MINKNKVTCSKEVTSQKWKVATSDAIHRPLFDSICIMQQLCRSNISNQLFERSLIADALEALNRCQLETQLKFALPSLTNQFTFRCICYIHDLLQRVEDLFRSIGSILPTLRHQFAQGAAETATSFMLKYYSTNDQNSRQSQPTEHWLNKHDGIVRRFVLHLYSSNTALRCLIPLDDYHLEWVSYLWAIMEFYAFQIHFLFKTGIDSSNPFSSGPCELNQKHYKHPTSALIVKQRPLVYVKRIKDYLTSTMNFDDDRKIISHRYMTHFNIDRKNVRRNVFHLLMVFKPREL